MENWKLVPQTSGLKTEYFVSDQGRCKSRRASNGRERILQGKIASLNSRFINYVDQNRIRKGFVIAREMVSLFLHQISEKDIITLKNNDVPMSIYNVQIVSRKDFGYMHKANLILNDGTLKPNCKITDEQRDHIKISSLPNNKLAEFYGISSMQVTRIKRGY